MDFLADLPITKEVWLQVRDYSAVDDVSAGNPMSVYLMLYASRLPKDLPRVLTLLRANKLNDLSVGDDYIDAVANLIDIYRKYLPDEDTPFDICIMDDALYLMMAMDMIGSSTMYVPGLRSITDRGKVLQSATALHVIAMMMATRLINDYFGLKTQLVAISPKMAVNIEADGGQVIRGGRDSEDEL